MIWSSNSHKFYRCFSAGQGAGSMAVLALSAMLAGCAQVPVSGPTDTALQANAASPANSASVAQGWRILFDQRSGNCVACHSIPDQKGAKTGIQSTFGPALDGVAARYSAAQLHQWVVDARKINPNTLMPPFGAMLSEQQVTDVLAALQTLR